MNEEYLSIRSTMQSYFDSGATLSVSARIEHLIKLKKTILQWEDRLYDACMKDLGKSSFETYETEIGIVQAEISHTLRHLKKWAKPKRVPTPLAHFPSSSYIIRQPKGVVLVMSPWNYPIQLSLVPLACALAAGCCVLLKPSRYSRNVSSVLKQMLDSCFDPALVSVVEGGHQANTDLLQLRWDHIFFTGSPAVGKIVMESAARQLCPVTLELGGKSPCIIDGSVNMKTAAVRLAWGKFLNAGQTCVAPDYLLINEKCRDEFVDEFRKAVRKLYPQGVNSPDLGKIINEKHFQRLRHLFENQKIIIGGEIDEKTMKIAPTLLDETDPESPVMQEEIFGPVMPVLTFDSLDEVIRNVNAMPHPLALYLFTSSKTAAKKVTARCGFGGGCINDTIIHLATTEMGFGGFGESGMGSYHGKTGFDTFTHYKSIVDKKTWLDLPMRYQPYRKMHEKMVRFFLK